MHEAIIPGKNTLQNHFIILFFFYDKKYQHFLCILLKESICREKNDKKTLNFCVQFQCAENATERQMKYSNN